MRVAFIFLLCFTICVSTLLLPWMALQVNAEEEQEPSNALDPVIHHAPESSTNEYSFPIFFDDRVVTGIHHQVDSFFEISSNKQTVPGSYIDVTFNYSTTLLDGLSFMTIFMDDVPIQSIPLTQENHSQQNVRLDLSHLTLGPGFHKLSFLVHMESTLLACENPDNPANWLVIHQDSHVYLRLTDLHEHIDLSLYPIPFYERGSPHPLQSIMVVPDQPQQEELRVVAKLSQFFAQQNFAERMHIPVYLESSLTEKILSNQHVIWVGQHDRWQSFGQQVMNDVKEKSIPDGWGNGFIGLVSSPWNEHYMHLMIAGNETELLNASMILTDPTLFSQLRGSYSVLSTDPIGKRHESESRIGQPVEITFSQLGYDHIVIQGVLHGYAHVSYHLPGNWDFSDDVTLRLKYTHSPSLHLDESVMVVRVNGIPVSSQIFSETEMNRGEIEVELPRRLLFNRRLIDIEVQIEFVSPGTRDLERIDECSDISLVGHWAVIDSASSLSFIPAPRKQYNLQSLPFPFVVEGQWNHTTVVFTDAMQQEHLETIMTLIGILGRDADHVSELRFAEWSDPDIEEQLQTGNVILLGSAETLPSPFFEFEHSVIRFSNGKVYSHSEQFEILPELQAESAIVQLTRSPFNEQYGLLQLVTTAGGDLQMIVNAFTDPQENHKISGKMVIIDNKHVVHPFAIVEPDPEWVEDRVDEEPTPKWSIQLILFVVLFVSLISLLVYMIRKSMKH